MDTESDDIKEVYARFGLALYCAQVLEHGIVNALVVVDLIPSRRHLARSKAEWEAAVDAFMGLHFEHTMGKLMYDLRSVSRIPTDLDDLLKRALKKRNWLAHEFFRERATEFLTSTGRDQMLTEVDKCRDLFKAADEALENVVKPLLSAAGITDEILEREYEAMRANL
ncbi:MAG TPA: hypothetical protein VKB05_17945 [Pyrinomonadaceae bacterium]|nr:hypothetical protein [Pyrinomonadaceae bacterium]